ncbi:transcriptional regulator [Neobacillus sp. OS1-32]|jgi:predicted ArsR family transcriptional regulator|uniref:Transcriptional regulator n=1 Tax=Neobacillus paridis TaxID=2803862 RepID=A0ABS1TL67_9BACI|nr:MULTISPECIES: metalloregulator ArsR/SmtB family transcription factor [Neobacillus]MBL4951283.1 transcriptional regulator [Neobacillus paridis]WML30599.1 transcriptional regulator [Neobacillus sp. OS1-32]
MIERISTKDKILELLKKKTNLTVSELSTFLGITEMAVRKHLNILERDSFLTINEVRKPMGRPIQVYSLSSKADELFPNHYETLTLEFLHDLEALHGEEIIDFLFEKRSERQRLSYLPKMANKNFHEKVAELQKIQRDKGYMAELNKLGQDTYELIEYNCPIFSVAKAYKKACTCETNMFKEVLGIENVQRITCKTDNEDHCRFLIKAQ